MLILNRQNLLAVFLLVLPLAVYAIDTAVKPALNGINIPEGYRQWQVIAPSLRTDKNSLRVILGNPAAMEAFRKVQTNPWPDGTILAKLVWNVKQHEKWPAATVPGEFTHVEFMLKDAKKFAATGGWGYARWLGKTREPYGKDANFTDECYQCHQTAKDSDYVFTQLPYWPE